MSHVQAGPPLTFGELALRHRLTLVVAGAGWGKSAMFRGLTDGGARASRCAGRHRAGPRSPSPMPSSTRIAATRRNATRRGCCRPYPTADSPDRRDQITALATNVCAVATRAVDHRHAGHPRRRRRRRRRPAGGFPRAAGPRSSAPAHLVVACRTQPNLRIARLRAAGEVARIGAEDLAVTPDDGRRFRARPGRAARPSLDIVARHRRLAARRAPRRRGVAARRSARPRRR